jgi:hypothetical protein
MPRVKTEDYLDDEAWDALEEAPEESSFEPYDGPQPPKDTLLGGYAKKMWWTLTKENEDPMIVCLWIAEGNEGDEEKYNGLPVFSYWPLVPGAKFRWAPAFKVLGFTLKDVRSKLIVAPEDEEDNIGIPIQKIGTFVPGEDTEAAWCAILTEEHEYDGVESTKAGKWLPWSALEEDTEEEDQQYAQEPDLDTTAQEAAPARPARGHGAGRAAGKPAATSAAKAPAARGRTSTPAATTGRPSSTGRPARTGSARPAARGKGRAAEPVSDEPPF